MTDTPVTDTPVETRLSWRRRHWRLTTILLAVVVPLLLFTGWALITVNFAYARDKRPGYVQKLSKRGWLCKTWEGELAMTNTPGAMPEIFRFTVRNDSLARIIDNNLGKRVSLTYEQHKGVPTSCFGETQYYITNIQILEP